MIKTSDEIVKGYCVEKVISGKQQWITLEDYQKLEEQLKEAKDAHIFHWKRANDYSIKIAEANKIAREVTVELRQLLRTELISSQQEWLEATINKMETLSEVLK